MAANPTRMLVLGVVSLFEPANGYQLGRELASWNVDYWANVKTGSIYSMLSTLAKQGLLEAHVLDESARAVKVYTVTDAGREELRRLIRLGIRGVSPMDPTGFRVAMAFTRFIDREEFLGLLEQRLRDVAAGEDGLSDAADQIFESEANPRNVGYSLRLESRLLSAERIWLAELIEAVRGGDLEFAGEPVAWHPPEDDPGWQMDADRRRYRRQLVEVGKIKSELPVDELGE